MISYIKIVPHIDNFPIFESNIAQEFTPTDYFKAVKNGYNTDI